MVELYMDELNIRNLIQKKKNKDIIRAKMKNENEKKHFKYNPQIIESNTNEDNDENENDENEEELTLEQKWIYIISIVKLYLKLID